MALIGGVWGGIAATRTLALSSRTLVGAVLDSGRLHELATQAVTLDIANSDFLTRLNQGPVQVTREDVERILSSTFDEGDSSAKAVEVHDGLVTFFRDHTGEGIFRVSIEEERPALVDSLGQIMLQQYGALPDCGLGDDIRALWSGGRVRFFDADGEEFFAEEHPDCRPPDVVADGVEEGIAEALAEMSVSGPDSVDAFPEEADDPDFARMAGSVQRGMAWTLPVWPALLLGMAVLGHAATARRRRGVSALLAAGLGLALYGGTLLLTAPARIDASFEGAGREGHASEIWAELGHYVIGQVVQVSGTTALLVGLAVAAACGGLALALRRRGHPG